MGNKKGISIKAPPEIHALINGLDDAAREAIKGNGIVLGQGKHRGYKTPLICELIRRGAPALLAEIEGGAIDFLQS